MDENLKHPVRCFVDHDGFVYSINEYGQSNHPKPINIAGNVVQILGECDPSGTCVAIDEEYDLWPSLTALAQELET